MARIGEYTSQPDRASGEEAVGTAIDDEEANLPWTPVASEPPAEAARWMS